MKLKNLNKWKLRDKSVKSNISKEELSILDKAEEYEYEKWVPKNEDEVFEMWKMLEGLG